VGHKTLTQSIYCVCVCITGTSSASLTGFQFGATAAVRTSGLSVSGPVASVPTIGFSFGTSELIIMG